MSTYENAVIEAKGLLGDQKAMKDSIVAVIMQSPTSKEYFAVRGNRLELLQSEGFSYIAFVDKGGNVSKVAA